VRRIPPALALACAAGAVLRFATLDLQSLWYDEAVTAHLLRMSLSGMLHAIPDSESSPPLYYLLAWIWTHPFGTGEVGLRSLSALLGTATIPVAWALGRRLGGDRAGLFAAAIVAVNPLLVWFGQEARAYALLVLLAALSALLWLRALERPSAGRAATWALLGALALATHYFAIFLVAPQALWLVLRAPGVRARVAVLAPLVAALAGLVPLAIGQRANDSAAFIRDSALLTRLAQVPKQLLVGYDAPAEGLLAVLSMLVLLIAVGGLARLIAASRRTPAGEPEPARRARADALRLAALASASLLLPAIAAVAGEDHLITRNVLAVAPLGAALAGAGLAAVDRARPWLGSSAIAAACVLGLVAVVGVDTDARLQRDDWRGAVHALAHASGDRLVVASPASALAPLGYYLPSARGLAAPAALTTEIDYLALAERSPGARRAPPHPPLAPAPAPGFVLAGRTDAKTFTVLRLRAAAPRTVPRAALSTGLDGRPAAVLVAAR
jgi:mannosyltransferase